MSSVSKHHGINDNMSLIAAAIIIPFIAFLGYKLYMVLKQDQDAQAEKLAKREAKKTKRGSKKD